MDATRDAETVPDDRVLVITRVFDAPRELVWKAFTDPERMRQWWGPKGFSVIASKMDLRPGGTYHYGMRAPDGTPMWGRFVYREIAVRQLYRILVTAAAQSAVVMLIVGAASVFAYVVTANQIAETVSDLLLGLTGSPVLIVLLAVIVLLVVGAFIDAVSALYLFVPIIAPVLLEAGVDVTTIGVMMVVNLALGLVTPPVGVNLFVAAGIAKVPLVEVVGGRATSESALERAMAFYRAVGKRPIRLRREILGHVANRLQAALWQEAFHLVKAGVARARWRSRQARAAAAALPRPKRAKVMCGWKARCLGSMPAA